MPFKAQGNYQKRLLTLAAFISGIVGGKSVQLPKIAENNIDDSKNDSREMKYRRWLNNKHINFKDFYLPFLEILLDSFKNQTLYIAIDGSVVGRGCMCLMVSLIYKNRALPLIWLVVKQKKGHLTEELHVELLSSLQNILPDGCNIILLGDGEFDGIDLQATIAGFGWEYVLRTAHNSKLYENNELFRFNEISASAPDNFIIIPNIEFTDNKYGPVNIVYWHEKGYQEPVYLVTNIELAEEACLHYKKRFKIETFFSDQKSRGFNIHKSHMDKPERIFRLLIAACLAYIWIIFLGTLAIKEQWYSVIHRKNRCDLSLFSMGLRLLKHFINKELEIDVGFYMLDYNNPFEKCVR